MPSPSSGPAPPPPLHCVFCGAEWDSGLFFGCPIPGREGPANKAPLICCHLCQATRSDADLRAQFYHAIRDWLKRSGLPYPGDPPTG